MTFWDIRKLTEGFPSNLWMSQGARGAIIGRLEGTIKTCAERIGLSINLRTARLALASEIYEREIPTFNALGDSEIWALDQWVLRHRAVGLGDWLRQQYGETLPLNAIQDN